MEELNKKLDALSKDLKFKGGRAALRRSAQIVAAQVRNKAANIDDPKTAEQIQKNVTVRWAPKHFRATGDLKFRVGILGGARAPAGSKQERATELKRRRLGYESLESKGEIAGKGKGNPGGDTYYWRWVEFGTEKAPAQPFMRPALSESAEQATDAFIARYKKSIDDIVKKII